MDFRTNLRTLRRRIRIAATIHVFILIVLVCVLGIAVRESGTSFMERRALGSGATTLILGAAVIFFLWQLVRVIPLYIADRARIVPYYSEKYFQRKAADESWAAFRGGYHIAAELPRLDELARHLGVPPLSSFGFADDVLKQTVQWNRPEDGLRTVNALLEHGDALSPGARADLTTLAAALEKAAEQQETFSLLVRFGKDDFISGVEMSKRQGNFWC